MTEITFDSTTCSNTVCLSKNKQYLLLKTQDNYILMNFNLKIESFKFYLLDDIEVAILHKSNLDYLLDCL